MALSGDERLLSQIGGALSPSGLVVRGAASIVDSERREFLLGNARSAVLIGNAGGAFWPIFEKWRAQQPVDLANPLDTWSRMTIDRVALGIGARAVYPSDRPYAPFQRWAMRAEGLRASPLGILMHPQFGTWHAYRGALLVDHVLPATELEEPIHICDRCIGKPCKNSCPAGAHAGDGFDYPGCLDFVRSDRGPRCREQGCMDRNACPYGVSYRYPEAMQAFLMNAFAG